MPNQTPIPTTPALVTTAESNEAVALARNVSPAVQHLVAACKHPGCDNAVCRTDGMCARHSRYRVVNAAIVKETEERLLALAPEMVDVAADGARRQAAEGDPKGAIELLKLSGAVKPPSPTVGTGGGLIVQVGIVLPGLPGGDE